MGAFNLYFSFGCLLFVEKPILFGLVKLFLSKIKNYRFFKNSLKKSSFSNKTILTNFFVFPLFFFIFLKDPFYTHYHNSDKKLKNKFIVVNHCMKNCLLPDHRFSLLFKKTAYQSAKTSFLVSNNKKIVHYVFLFKLEV